MRTSRAVCVIATVSSVALGAALTFFLTSQAFTPVPKPTTYESVGELFALTGSWRMSVDAPNTTGVLCSLHSRTCQMIVAELVPPTLTAGSALELVDRLFPIVETNASTTIAQEPRADDECAVQTLRIDHVQNTATVTIEPKRGAVGCTAPVVLVGTLPPPLEL